MAISSKNHLSEKFVSICFIVISATIIIVSLLGFWEYPNRILSLGFLFPLMYFFNSFKNPAFLMRTFIFTGTRG